MDLVTIVSIVDVFSEISHNILFIPAYTHTRAHTHLHTQIKNLKTYIDTGARHKHVKILIQIHTDTHILRQTYKHTQTISTKKPSIR